MALAKLKLVARSAPTELAGLAERREALEVLLRWNFPAGDYLSAHAKKIRITASIRDLELVRPFLNAAERVEVDAELESLREYRSSM